MVCWDDGGDGCCLDSTDVTLGGSRVGGSEEVE